MNDTQTQIEAIVEELTSKSWITPTEVVVLRSFLYASDTELEQTLSVLTALQASLKELDTKYTLEEKNIFDEYMIQISDLQTKTQRVDLEAQETFSDITESTHQEGLLNQLTHL